MYKRILPVLLACMIFLCGIQSALAQGSVSLEGALRLEEGNVLLYGARQGEKGENAWCACVNDRDEIQWEKTGEAKSRYVQAMEWDAGIALISMADEDAACTLICLEKDGDERKAPKMPEGTGYLRLGLESVLAYGAYQGRDGGYVLRMTRVDDRGERIWQRDYSAHAEGWNLPLSADDGNRLYFAGAWNQQGKTVYSVLGMDPAGEILWNTALEADYVSVLRAGKDAVLALGEEEGCGFAVMLDAQGRQKWRIDVEETPLDAVVEGENVCLLTQSDGMLCMMRVSAEGEILSQQMSEWADAVLNADEKGEVRMYAADGDEIEAISLKVQEAPGRNVAEVSVEWIGMEGEKTFRLEDAQMQETIRGFLHEGKNLQPPPAVGAMGERRFEISLVDMELELYWNALKDNAYLKAGEIWYEMKAGHGEYLLKLCRALEEGLVSEQVSESHRAYLEGFGWEIAWKNAEETCGLPASLSWTAEDEAALYWAFHEKLIEMGGGSLQGALGEEVEVSLYAVYPRNWQSPAEENMLLGIVVEKEENVLGGYVTQGHAAKRTWSLTGESVQGDVNRFLLERSAAPGMEQTQDAQQVLRAFLDAWQKQDAQTMLLWIAPERELDELICSGQEKSLFVPLEQRMQTGLGWPGRIENVGEISEDEGAYRVACLCGGEEVSFRVEMRKNMFGSWEIADIRKMHW